MRNQNATEINANSELQSNRPQTLKTDRVRPRLSAFAYSRKLTTLNLSGNQTNQRASSVWQTHIIAK